MGVIGNIVDSCTEIESCYYFGQGLGKVGHVTDLCKGESSCQNVSHNRGSIGSILQSCNDFIACYNVGSGSVSAITSDLNSCCNECNLATQTTLPVQCNSKVRLFIFLTYSCLFNNVSILCSTRQLLKFRWQRSVQGQ